MKLKLPLPSKEQKRILFLKSNWTNDQTKFYYALKDLSQKHPYYWIPVEVEPFTVLIDTLGRWMWGLTIKDVLFWGAVRLEALEDGCQIYLPEEAPQQVKEILSWCVKQLENSKKEKKNDNSGKKQKRRKV